MNPVFKKKVKDELQKSLKGDFSLYSVLRVLPLCMELVRNFNISGRDKRELVIEVIREICGGDNSCTLSGDEIGVIIDTLYNSWLGVYRFSKKGCCC